MTDALTDVDIIRDLEERRFHAMRDGDAGTLATLLADDLVYLHADATGDTKPSLLARIRSGELRCTHARHQPDRHVVAGGDTAIATSRVTGTVYVHGSPVDLDNRALAVWRRHGGRWRLLAYQSTPVPGGREGTR